MAKRTILAWYPQRACWKKQINKRVFYFGTGGVCKNKEDQTGYEIALGEYLTLKRRLSIESPKGAPVVDPIDAAMAAAFPAPANLQNVAAFAMPYADVAPVAPAATATINRPPTIKALIDEYTAEYKLRVGQDVGLTAWQGQCQSLADLLKYAKKRGLTSIDDFDTPLLKGYAVKQREYMNKGDKGASPSTVRKRLTTVKQLVDWAFQAEYVDVKPRIVDSRKYAAIKVPTPAPTMLTREQVDELWLRLKGQAGNGKGGFRNALIFAISLNCGYKAGDVSSLLWSMIVERDGETYIERTRKKTGQIQIHKLWKITVQLLKLAGTDPAKSENVLLDNAGGLLCKMSDKGISSDQINAYWKNLNMPWKCLHSYLRKTAADFLEREFPQYERVVSMFLGHKVAGVKFHYVNGHHEILHSCTDAYGRELDLTL